MGHWDLWGAVQPYGVEVVVWGRCGALWGDMGRLWGGVDVGCVGIWGGVWGVLWGGVWGSSVVLWGGPIAATYVPHSTP